MSSSRLILNTQILTCAFGGNIHLRFTRGLRIVVFIQFYPNLSHQRECRPNKSLYWFLKKFDPVYSKLYIFQFVDKSSRGRWIFVVLPLYEIKWVLFKSFLWKSLSSPCPLKMSVPLLRALKCSIVWSFISRGIRIIKNQTQNFPKRPIY